MIHARGETPHAEAAGAHQMLARRRAVLRSWSSDSWSSEMPRVAEGAHAVAKGVALFLVGASLLSSASADTLEGALVLAYQNNPQINAQRAAVRVSDENVPQALSGYRPRVSITGSLGEQYLDVRSKTGTG